MEALNALLFPALIILIFYLIVFRPQQRKMKEHQNMVANLHRGDQVVTQGGLKGKVTKVLDGENEVEVELAKDVRVRVVQSTIADVLNKSEPAK